MKIITNFRYALNILSGVIIRTREQLKRQREKELKFWIPNHFFFFILDS